MKYEAVFGNQDLFDGAGTFTGLDVVVHSIASGIKSYARLSDLTPESLRNHPVCAMRRIIKEPVQHSDNTAVDLFAAKMKEKLEKSRDKGRRGWESCPIEHLITSLKDHISKGDPVDVANFAMMISQRGESIKTPVWTKADQEKGILPTVGCLCIEGMYPEEVIAVTSKYIVTKTKTDGVCTTSIETFKRTYRPIETPREKYDRERDECIDKLLAKIPPSPITVVPAMKILYEELRPFTGGDHD